MEYPNLDDEFRRIIKKADRIVAREVIQQERLETLTKLREEDGRLKIKIQQLKSEIEKKQEEIEKAKNLLSEYELYFSIINKYSGEEQQDELHEQIDGYNWPEYSKIQDELYALTKDKSMTELENHLTDLKLELEKYETKRGELVDNSIMIIAEIDKNLEELS